MCAVQQGFNDMSEVKANDFSLIRKADEVMHLYSGVGASNMKAGLESEMAFFNPSSPTLDVMSLSQNRVVKNAAQAALEGDWIHNEPTSELLEIATIAGSFSQLQEVIDDADRKIGVLKEKAESVGLKRSYFQELPERTADDLLSRIVDVERYKVMYAPYRSDMKETVRYFAVCKSNQVSVSYQDQDHALENVRRLYFLSPFFFLLTDNSTGFIEGKSFKGHAGMALRHNGLDLGRGGVMPYAMSAKSGEEFFVRHIEHVFNNPLFMFYNERGVLERVPNGNWDVNFHHLKERGLNTKSNYFLAQSVLWPDVKIAALKDEQGNVYNHRFEARMFGVGLHQHRSALVLTAGLAMHKDFAADVDDLLIRYGFDPSDSAQAAELLDDAYDAARFHQGKFFDIAYGNGTMREFAKEFADCLENHADDFNLEDAIEPILSICRSGCTDGKINRILFPTLKDVLHFQKMYNPDVFANRHHCAKTLFAKELRNLNKDTGANPCCCG